MDMDTKVENNPNNARLIVCPFRKFGETEFQHKMCYVTTEVDSQDELNLVKVVDQITGKDILPEMDSMSKLKTLRNIASPSCV